MFYKDDSEKSENVQRKLKVRVLGGEGVRMEDERFKQSFQPQLQ